MKIKWNLIVIIWIFLPLITLGSKQIKPSQPDRSVSAVRLTNTNIDIDGRLDDKIWIEIPRQSQFLQRNPDDGAAPSQQTEFAICYDTDFLYIGVRAYDDQPDQITGILTRRDESSPSDWVYVSLDSYNDHRTAFEFGLNAAGVKQDLRRFDDDSMDFDWDAVWEGAVSKDSEGWTAEFAIPFRELRFNNADELTWGLNVYRELPRHDNELAIWSHWSRAETGFVSNYGELTGLKGIQAKNPLYISPYIMAQRGMDDQNLTDFDDHENSTNIGADIRKSFALGLTFSGTVNPDFGQVEADPAEFNLTEFESYFREKRPFFMEGGNILNFSLGFGDGDNSSNTLFYSRRIGRAPQGYAETGDAEDYSIETPENTRILAAGKLTGKLDNGLSIGVMSAATAEEKATVTYSDGTQSQNVVEPATKYLLTRVQKDYREGLTTLGGIFTATLRSLDETDMDWLREKAFTGGLDFGHRFGNREYDFTSSLAFSHVIGSEDAILNTQLHPSRYFQRPDAPHLTVDSLATSLSGYGGKIILGRNWDHYSAYGGILATSPSLEVNDLGFMRAVDNINEFFWLSYREWEASEIFLNYQINFNQWVNWTFGGEMKSFGGNVNGNGTLANNWQFSSGLNFNIGGIVPYHLHGGPSIQGPNNLNAWVFLGTDGRRELSVSGNASYFYNDDEVKSFNMSPSVNWRPRENISLAIGPDFNYLDDTWAWITAMVDTTNDPHYIFSGLKLAQTSITFRADVTLSTALSLQYYTQVFLTGGDFHDFVEVDDNTSKDFDERFRSWPNQNLSFEEDGSLGGIDIDQDGIIDYEPDSYVYSDFNHKELTSNMVLRWEYSTGSVMYLVWSRGAAADESFWSGDIDIGGDLRSLFDLNANNIFLIKVNKLLNI
ncbi:carbohydrate binding family 9 domain-containing protein [bacterium]|nr:carbohydrate binding family 9 domain-containing protein [bacterium]